MEFLNKFRTNLVVNAVLTIVIGIFFIINPGGTGRLIALAAGILILVAGIVAIVRFLISGSRDLTSSGILIAGIVMLILGIIILTHTGAVLTLLIYLFAVYVLIGGIFSMRGALRLRETQSAGWVAHVVLAVVIIAAAVFMLIFPFAVVNTAIIVSGVILVADGVIELVTGVRMNR